VFQLYFLLINKSEVFGFFHYYYYLLFNQLCISNRKKEEEQTQLKLYTNIFTYKNKKQYCNTNIIQVYTHTHIHIQQQQQQQHQLFFTCWWSISC
jgi:hypothetical protein